MTSSTFEQMAREFPDYDQSTLPAIPADWRDVSWHNDACPSFQVAEFPSYSVFVFADFADMAMREYEGGSRYMVVMVMSTTGEAVTLLETDNFEDVRTYTADDGHMRDIFPSKSESGK